MNERMGELLVRWQSPDLVEALIGAMRHLDGAWRAEYVLRRLTNKVPPSSREMFKLGSEVTWARTYRRWRESVEAQRSLYLQVHGLGRVGYTCRYGTVICLH